VCGKAVIWFAQLHLHISWKSISVVMGICNEEAKAVGGTDHLVWVRGLYS